MVVAALVASVALFVTSLALLVTSVALYYRLTATAPNAPSLPTPGVDSPEAAELPPEIEDWISQESEPWARQELKQKARALYMEHEDWVRVQAELVNQLGEPSESPEESLNRL